MNALLTRLGCYRQAHPARRVLTTAVASLLAVPALMLATIAPAQAATTSATEPDVGVLTSVRASHHPGFDRVVWQFDGPLPQTRKVDWVTQLNNGSSDLYLPVAGNAILRLTMFNARAHRQNGDTWVPTVPLRQTFALHNVTEVVQNDDWEAVVGYGIGLNKKTSYKLFTLSHPNRVVLDIRTDYATSAGSVRFLNQPNYVKGVQPYTQNKARTFVAASPASSAMNHLFAGPTAAEYAAGMRVVKSKATGWKNLSISNGIARVTLTGGCNSGGSTMTVATLITPTLKQFSTVKYVKIYDPSGRTARPTGNSDSIPTCLEP